MVSASSISDGSNHLTLPFSVVAANNLASIGHEESCSIVCVVCQASDCRILSAHSTEEPSLTYRFLKFLQELVRGYLILTLNIALHGRERCQDGSEGPPLRSFVGHVVESLVRVGEGRQRARPSQAR